MKNLMTIKIYSFTSEDPIIKYHSEIGNNDVPYPIAESKNQYFFMLDQIQMYKKDFRISAKYQPDRINDFTNTEE